MRDVRMLIAALLLPVSVLTVCAIVLWMLLKRSRPRRPPREP